MHYVDPVIRPPSEADSILLQVTTGCSHNKCTFCGIYKDKPFSIKPDSIIDDDIDCAARTMRHVNRLFLIDGDALIVPQGRLVRLLERIRERLPWVRRIGTYANARSIARKSDTDLRALRELGLKVFHMGLESGDDAVLAHVRKYGTSADIIAQARRARDAGFKLFVTVILGLGGVERSREHAMATGHALSAIDPSYVGALSLMLLENTGLYEECRKGEFEVPAPGQLLEELRSMIEHTSVSACLFFSNHASNHLPIQARLPSQKQAVLDEIDRALRGQLSLRPEWLRGL